MLRPRLRRILTCLLFLSLCSFARAQDVLSAERIRAIDEIIAAEMTQLHIPGLSVAVATDLKPRWTNGYGLADIENNVPARAWTVYRLGSISKPITAVAAMQLVDQGKLKLETQAQTLLPEFPRKQWPITLRNLLTHQSGVRHYKPNEIESSKHYTSVITGLEIFKNDPLLHAPGEKHTYTTYGYCLIGAMVERASGIKFDTYLHNHIFEPSGMDRTQVDDWYAIIPNRAQGYTWNNGKLRNSGPADTSYKIPGGGLSATAEDMVKFGCAFFAGKLVKLTTVEEMSTQMPLKSGAASNYGLGWATGKYKETREVSHSGAQQRVSTLLYARPDQKIVVAILCNLEGASLRDLARKIADKVSSTESQPDRLFTHVGP